MNTFITAVLLGFGAFYCTCLIRALPPFVRWTELQIKPWSCDVCMSAWTTLVLFVVYMIVSQPIHCSPVIVSPSAMGICFLLLKLNGHLSPAIGKLPGE